MDAFAALCERHYADVYRLALFLTGDPAGAEDLASETFVRARMARDQIHEPTVRAYLLAITRNLYRDQLRRSRRLIVELDDRARDAERWGQILNAHFFHGLPPTLSLARERSRPIT